MICHRQPVAVSLSVAIGVAALVRGSIGLQAQETNQESRCGTFTAVPEKRPTSALAPTLVVQTGHTPPPHKAHVTSIAFTPDDLYALTGTQDGTAILWELRSGLQIRRLGGHMGYVLSVAISEDGKFALTAVADGAVHLWRLDLGTEVMVLRAPEVKYTRVAFADGGASILAAAQDGSLCRWRSSDGRVLDRFAGVSNPSALATSKEGVWMAAGAPPPSPQATRTIKLWHPDRRGTPVEVPDYCAAAAFNSKETAVVCGGQDGATRVFSAADGILQKTFTGDAQAIVGVAAGPGDEWIASASADSIHVWSTASGTRRLRIAPPDDAKLTALAVTRDGSTILGGDNNGITYLWDAASGRAAGQLRGRVALIRSLAVSKDKTALYAGDAAGTVHVWDLEEGVRARALKVAKKFVNTIQVDPLGQALLTSIDDGDARLNRLDDGTLIRALRSPDKERFVWTSTFSKKGDVVATGNDDGSIQIWARQSGKLLRTFKGDKYPLFSVEFLKDDRYLVSSGYMSTIIRSYPGGKEVANWERREIPRNSTGHIRTSFLPFNTSGAVTSEALGRIVRGSDSVVQVLGAKAIHPKDNSKAFYGALERHYAEVTAVAFSPDQHIIASAAKDRTTRLWSSQTGQLLHVLEGHDDWVMALAFISDKVLATASHDGTVRLWNVKSGTELVRLIAFNDGEWAVVDGSGFFHTSNPDAIPGLHWVFPGSFEALPPELFMKDFYEPRLLPGKFSGTSMERNVTLQGKNIAQPEIEIAGITPGAGKPETVDVSIKVRGTPSQNLGPGGSEGSGVYDVRLFRNGKLVARSPGGAITADTISSIASWREERQVLAGLGETTLTFKGINIPKLGANRQIEFSAYAFNEDRVKSATARMAYAAPVLSGGTATAYVVSIGVNAFEDPKNDLTYASADARGLAEHVSNSLRATRQFGAVVPVVLTSDWVTRAKVRHVTEKAATKANIKGVFDLLARRPVPDSVRSQIKGAAGLKPATPDDLVILSISTHGYLSKAAEEFYLFPYDGTSLDTAISGQDLSDWIEGIDAREIVLVVDACQASTIVDVAGFRPGPLGGRGVGQLAYDKGIKVLVAARGQDPAWESEKIGQGLLSFALIRQGLLGGRADTAPKDGQVNMREWLTYPVSAVPRLFEEVVVGKERRFRLVPIGRAARGSAPGENAERDRPQRPALFDFRKQTMETPILVRAR